MNAALNHARADAPPCPSDLWHDAAVIEDGNGCSWGDALDGAAASLGYADHADACDAILTDWRSRIIGAQPTTERGRVVVRDALRLLMANGGDLVAMGWGAVDLFGHDPRRERHGLAFRLGGGVVQLVGNDGITFRAGAVGRVTTFDRMTTAGSACPFWELNG